MKVICLRLVVPLQQIARGESFIKKRGCSGFRSPRGCCDFDNWCVDACSSMPGTIERIRAFGRRSCMGCS